MLTSRRTLIAAATLALAVSPALAQDAIETVATDFVSADGYQSMPLEHIEGALDDMLDGPTDGMMPLGADISPIEKALLLIESQEVPLQRARYLVQYRSETIDNVEVAFIDVLRFNLGPAIRLETIEAYGEENTAGPEDFGVGPHVAWRFVTQPVAKSAALLLAAGRNELSEDIAIEMQCGARACLWLGLNDELAQWSEPESYEERLDMTAYPAVVLGDFGGTEAPELAPAYLALQAGIAAGVAEATGDGVLWTLPAPEATVIIDRNLGQDIISETLLGIGDDWVRTVNAVYEGTIYETVMRTDDGLN